MKISNLKKITKAARSNVSATTASKPEIKKDENRKIKLSDTDFNLETVKNSKSKEQKKRKKYEESSSEESDEDSSADKSNYQAESLKKKTKKNLK